MNYRVWGKHPDGSACGSREIEANTAAKAAETWAEEADAELPDAPIANGTPVEVFVRAFGDHQPRRFWVSGEQHYTYRAQIAPATKKEG